MKQRYAIYDFCQTLVDMETADEFIKYILEKKSLNYDDTDESKIVKKLINRIYGKITHRSLKKKKLLYSLKGLKREEINEYAYNFYEDKIKKRLIKSMVTQMINDKKNGYKIVILSASYYPILKPFVKEYDVDILITNEFEYKNNRFIGKIIGKDCVYKEKCKKLKNIIDDISLEESIAYGDSYTDIPILALVGTGVVVSKEVSKKWNNGNFKEIVWNE